ncbi:MULTISPECIES: hypothetical protein [Epilithonimonas]|uniref:hypothetical protein n=1 Tax=Epilithonimonas TaxID=2782229 RepID=UPI0028A135F6|nr:MULTISPECIES: hypothetical protein [Epilithonimonas]
MINFLIKLFKEGEAEVSTPSTYTFNYHIESTDELDLLVKLNYTNIRYNNKNISEDDVKVDSKYSFDLVWSKFRKYGFYIKCEDFLIHNKKESKDDFYILEIDSKRDIKNCFVKNYLDNISLITYVDELSEFKEDENIIFSENKYLKLPIEYSEKDLDKTLFLFPENFSENFLKYFRCSTKEIQYIFKNELIDFLREKPEKERFKFLLKNLESYYNQCLRSVDYYLSNYSFNKIKLELDNSVLDFSTKIRSVINDSQGKLITIPATAVLAFSTFDFFDPFNIKNFVIVLASATFAYLMNIFINNQVTALDIIKNNISNYKAIFKNKNKEEISDINSITSSVFFKTENELLEQRKMLFNIKVINWLIPIIIIAFLFYLVYSLRR